MKHETPTLEQAYTQYRKMVYGVCWKIVGNHEEAEELTQDVFLRLCRHIGSFNGDSKFSTWLHRIAANVALMHLRSSRRRGYSVSIEELTNPNYIEAGAEEAREKLGTEDPRLRSAGARQMVEKGLARLSPVVREATLLYYIDGYEQDEIAEIMGRTHYSVKSLVNRGRIGMRQRLRSGGESL